VVATQSQPLRAELRRIPAVPIVHINRSVMVLEPPSDATVQAKERVSSRVPHAFQNLQLNQMEEQSLHPTASDMNLVSSTATPPIARKKKGPKGPNPLSVKKKKVSAVPSKKDKGKSREDHSDIGAKRKRNASEDGEDNHTSPSKKRKHHKPTSIPDLM
jgi:U3 small nucleolar RNA-associated protein 23